MEVGNTRRNCCQVAAGDGQEYEPSRGRKIRILQFLYSGRVRFALIFHASELL